MRLVGYSLFGIALLVVFIFVLQPDNKPATDTQPSAITRKVEEDVAHRPLKAEKSEPVVLNQAEQKFEPKQVVEPSSSHSDPAGTEEAVRSEGESEKVAGVLVETPEENPFDMSGVPDFPPLPPLEDDGEVPPFGDMDLEKGLDEAGDLSGWTKLPPEGEQATPSETEEF